MYRLTMKAVCGSIFLQKWRPLSHFVPRHFPNYSSLSIRIKHRQQVHCFRDRKTAKTTKKVKEWRNVLDEKETSHILWWKERLEACRKASTAQLITRLDFSNLLRLNVNLKNGSVKEGNLNWEILQFKSRFPREILLCRVGDFYEAIGIDACVLVEYAGLNPFGGLRSDSIPRAGCPVVNLRQTLDDLTRNGYSVVYLALPKGTCRWGEFGEGGLLWAECSSRYFEWFEGDPVKELLLKVKHLYGLDNEVAFRNIGVPSEDIPRPLHLGTAAQIGAIPTEGIPCLLRVLLPSSCTGLPQLYIRDLLLNPPAYTTASKIQDVPKLMSSVTCSLPEFTCVSSAKLVKLLELREANHIEFSRIKKVAEEILQLNSNSELCEILELLMDPTCIATGLKLESDKLASAVAECELVSHQIGELISQDGDIDQELSSFSLIPDDFFEDIEPAWKGRVKRKHMESFYEEIDEEANALHTAVSGDFLPIISRRNIICSRARSSLV